MSTSRRQMRLADVVAYVAFAGLVVIATSSLIWAASTQGGVAVTAPTEVSTDIIGSARAVYDARLHQYQAMTTDVRSLLYLMVVTSAVAIYTLIVRPKTFKLPFLDFRADAVWLRISYPLVLAYTWLHFGYALYTAATCRRILVDVGRIIERPLTSKDLLADAISDGGIVDFFSFLTSPDYEFQRAASPWNVLFSWLLVSLLYCGLLGVVHACMLRGATELTKSPAHRRLGWMFLLSVVLLLLGSHVAFAEKMNGLWFAQLCIAVTGAGAYWGIGIWARPAGAQYTSRGVLLLDPYVERDEETVRE